MLIFQMTENPYFLSPALCYVSPFCEVILISSSSLSVFSHVSMIKNLNFQEPCFALHMFLLALPVLSWVWHFPFCPWREPHRVTVIHSLPLGRGALVFPSPAFCPACCSSFSECVFPQTCELWADVQLTWVLRHCGNKEFILAVITHHKHFFSKGQAWMIPYRAQWGQT